MVDSTIPTPDLTRGTLGTIPGDDVIYRGDRVDLVRRSVTTNTGKQRQREVLIHPGAVLVLPILADGRIVLIRNKRHTVMQTLIELCAGTLEKGEDPAVCAGRELIEETGYRAATITPFGWFYTSPGILTEKMYVFRATGLTPERQALEDNEQIDVFSATLDETIQMILQNQIVDAKTIAVLLKYRASLAQKNQEAS